VPATPRPPAASGTAPAVASAPPASAPATAPPPPSPAAAAPGKWTVYANPTRDLLAAEHERAALRAKGYAAEVVTLKRDGDLWYRIRVGRYATQAQAEEAARRLRNDGSAHGFVQSE
jgi:cell division protein FtsN